MPKPTARAAQCICLLMLPVAGFAVYGLTASEPLPEPASFQDGPSPPGLLVDPNTAAWWELTVIPGIGETTAKGIVEFREEHRRRLDQASDPASNPVDVFRRPADLERVQGIGPKTVIRIAPYLTLGSNLIQDDRDDH